MFIRHKKLILSGLATVWLGVAPVHALVENFSSDPFSTWSFGVGNNSSNQFVWNSSSPAAYTGDAVGSLDVHFNSSLPTARFQRSLGVSLTDTDSFQLSTRFSFSVASAPTDGAMQLAFGLVNSSTTGGDRTGSFANFFGDNVFSTVEFNYFPNVNTFNGNTTGPSLAPAVFGAQSGSTDAFGNFTSLFGSDSDLGNNNVGITALPQNAMLEAMLDYSSATKVLTLTLNQVNLDGSLTLLNTGVPILDLNVPGAFTAYDSNFPFLINSLAIMAYQDGFTSPADPSLVADMTFQRFELTLPSTVPEPSSVALVALGLGVLGTLVRNRIGNPR